VALATFTPSDNGGKQAFTINAYPNAGEVMLDYFDEGDDLSFTYDGNYYTYTIVDITGEQITMSFDYNAAITNVNTTLQFSKKVQGYPYNFLGGKFTWEKDKDNFFYRLKYQGRVKFKDNREHDDYSYLLAALDDGCCKVLFKVYKLCSGTYSLFYRANITRFEGTWNESQCTFESEIPPVDKYECMLANTDKEVDIYNCPEQVAVYLDDDPLGGFTPGPFYEYLVRATVPVAPGDIFTPASGADFQQVNGTGGEAADSNTGNPWTLYAREKKVVIYDGDLNFTPPAIGGYTLTGDPVYVDNKVIATYTQAIGAGDAPEYDTKVWGTGGICESETTMNMAIYDPINDNCLYTSPDFPAANVTTSYNSRLLSQVLGLFKAQCGGLSGVTSDFFEIDPEGDTPGYSSGVNYVTGLTNYVANIRISHITDVTNPSVNNAAYLNVSFGTFMKQLNSMFNVYWFIDTQNRIRVEHHSYFINNSIVSLVGLPPNGDKKIYTYIKEDVPRREIFKFQNASNIDFIGADIIYPDACSSLITAQKLADQVTTDIYFLRNTDISKISNQGMVFFACQAGTNLVLREQGQLTGIVMGNNHLSWANLHYNYHQHGRVLPEGLLNYVDTNFLSWKKRKKQVNQKYLGCCLEIPETLGTVTTEVGTGDATKITFDPNSNTYEFELEI
jgi:hypothetical protein